jgi:hypothetical protein
MSVQPGASSLLIDNSRHTYLPIRLHGSGVLLMCRPEVLWTCPHILALLHQDVGDVLALLPDNLRHLVRRTRIWVNHTYAYGAREKPVVVQHMTTHHHHAWLLWYDVCACVCVCVYVCVAPGDALDSLACCCGTIYSHKHFLGQFSTTTTTTMITTQGSGLSRQGHGD